MAGLRERKKFETMRRIQEVAVALFRARGFDEVTVEEVAAAAEASPSTIYRYFGTKEGLLLHDEYDDTVLTTFTHEIEAGVPLIRAATTALASVAEEHFGADREETRFRIDLWQKHRGVQAAAAAHVTALTEDLTPMVAEAGRLEPAEARFVVSALVNGLLSAVITWHREGAQRPVEDYFQRGLAALGGVMGELGALGAPDEAENRRTGLSEDGRVDLREAGVTGADVTAAGVTGAEVTGAGVTDAEVTDAEPGRQPDARP